MFSCQDVCPKTKAKSLLQKVPGPWVVEEKGEIVRQPFAENALKWMTLRILQF